MTFGPDDQETPDYPAARKSDPFQTDHPGPGDPYSAPAGEDLWPEFGGAAFPPSSPYSAPQFGGSTNPPPPIGPRTRSGNGPNRARRNALMAGVALFAVVLTSCIGTYLIVSPPTHSKGPVAVVIPTGTATLPAGETPLPTRIPTSTPLPGVTPTPIPYASKAVVTFMLASQAINSIPSTFKAAVSGVNIPAKQESGTAHAGDSGNATSGSDASYDPGSHVTVTLSVKNNSSNVQLSSGDTIPSTTSGVSCTLQGDLTLNPGQSGLQQCFEPKAPEPAVSYNYTTTDGTKLTYTGSASAGGSTPYYYVPSDCNTDNHQLPSGTGNLSAAKTAAKTTLQAQMNTQTSGGTLFNGPNFSLDSDSTSVCNPTSSYPHQASSFQYTVSIGGTSTETTYNQSDAATYQSGLLNAAASNLNPHGSWQLIHSSVCASPSAVDIDATSANITCAASGTAGWIWTSSQTSNVANLISGESKSNAIASLNAVQGVKSGSISIALTGGTYLPNDPAKITLKIITP